LAIEVKLQFSEHFLKARIYYFLTRAATS
jgi:hypothetical protein